MPEYPLWAWEVVNPSDEIHFRATREVAELVAIDLRESWLFVRHANSGDDPLDPPAEANEDEAQNRIGDVAEKFKAALSAADPVLRNQIADAFASFTLGSARDLDFYHDAIGRMDSANAAEFAAKWDDQKRTSMNNICGWAHQQAEKIRAIDPAKIKETANEQ